MSRGCKCGDPRHPSPSGDNSGLSCEDVRTLFPARTLVDVGLASLEEKGGQWASSVMEQSSEAKNDVDPCWPLDGPLTGSSHVQA